MNCIFCKIINGEVPTEKVYEDEKVLAFLDVRPVADGHTIVIPKNHAEEFHQLNDEDYSALMDAVKKVSSAIKIVYRPPRVGVVVYGFHVAHAHIHVFPNTGKAISMQQIEDYSEARLKPEAEKLKSNIKV